jgi:lactam utilization protein B
LDRPEYDRTVARVRAALGEAAFAEAWEEGQSLTMEQAVKLATDDTVAQGASCEYA